MGCRHSRGKPLQGHAKIYFVSHVNKVHKGPVARHIQMLVSVTCMSSNNNQVFGGCGSLYGNANVLFFCHNGQICVVHHLE